MFEKVSLHHAYVGQYVIRQSLTPPKGTTSGGVEIAPFGGISRICHLAKSVVGLDRHHAVSSLLACHEDSFFSR